MNNDYRFDNALRFGKQGEQWINTLGAKDGDTVETKTCRLWKTYGSIIFEYRCRGQKSGIAKTEATYFNYVLFDEDLGQYVGCYVFKMDLLLPRLRKLVKAGIATLGHKCGDDKLAEGARVKLEDVWRLYYE